MRSRAYSGMAALCVLIALGVAVTAWVGVFARGGGAVETVTSVRGETYRMTTEGIYAYNSERLVAEGVGWDVFTLFGAVPGLLIAAWFVRRGSLRGRLFALGVLGYLFYQYLMYAVAWAFGPLFVPFVAIYAASMLGIIWISSATTPAQVAAAVDVSRFPRRSMAVLSGFMALMLVGMWAQRILIALDGRLSKAMLLGSTTLSVQALDLGLVVPLALLTAVLLWRARPVGYLLGAVFVVKAVAMAAAICAMLVSAWMVEGSMEWGGLASFGVPLVLFIVVCVRMYRGIHERGAASSPS